MNPLYRILRGVGFGPLYLATLGLIEQAAQENRGGDDAFHPGWNKAAWQRKKKREDAITDTIEATYLRIIGIEPDSEVVAQVKREINESEVQAVFQPQGWSKELEFMDWLQDQFKAIQEQQELDDEETLLFLI